MKASKEKRVVVIATGIYPPDIGGPATYSRQIALALAYYGHKVTVLTYGPKREDEAGVSVKSVGSFWPKGMRHILYLCKLVPLARKADIIYAQNSVSVGVPVYFASKLLRKPYAVKIVGDYAWEISQQKKTPRSSIEDFQHARKKGWIKLLDGWQRRVAKNASIIIVPSRFLASIAEGWGADKIRIKVINNGVTVNESALSKENAKARIGVSGNIILSIGRLVPWKGFRMLIKLMPELLKLNPFFRLVIIGDGPEMEPLERIRQNLGLANKVFLAGKKNREELSVYYNAADMFVLNTGYEGFSHQIIEAMAAGVPVITTNVCGNPEIVVHGMNGFLVDYNDEQGLKEAIQLVADHDEMKEKFKMGGLLTADGFSEKRMINETLKALQ